MPAQPLNNAAGALRYDHLLGSDTLILKAGQGALFGTPTVDSPVRVTVARLPTLVSGRIEPATTETIYLCTARSGDTLSGLTAAEGTSDQRFYKNDPVQALITAGMLQDIIDSSALNPSLVLTTETYEDPDWLTGLAQAKVLGLALTLEAKADLDSPPLTGTPTAPTAAPGTNTTQLATTAFVAAGLLLKADAAATTAALLLKAPLDSPPLTGTPTAPTATAGTNTTQLATTAFVAAGLLLKADDTAVVKLTGTQTIAGVKTFSGQITANAGIVLANGVSIIGSGISSFNIGDANDTVGLAGGAFFAITTKVYTSANVPFYAGSANAGASNAQLESKSPTASTPIFAGYASTGGAAVFAVGPLGDVTTATVSGGTTAAADLTLQSTSHATKGKIKFGTTTYFNEATASFVNLSFGGTSGRVVIETTGGVLTDSANLTYASSVLTVGTAGFGNGAGTDSTIAGSLAAAAGTNAAAFGRQSSASGTASVAFGPFSLASQNSAVAIGASATASISNGVAIGALSSATHIASIAIGASGKTFSDGNISFFTGARNPELSLGRYTSTTDVRQTFGIQSEWVVSTDASRTARAKLGAYDFGGFREGLRLESDGTKARLTIAVPPSAPVDANVPTGQVAFWLDESANKLMFRVRYSDGTTLKSGEIALT